MGGVEGGVKTVLRLEGLAMLAGAALFYRHAGGDWRLFALLFLAPDLSFLGYVFGVRVGAMAYNSAHSTIGPIMLAAVAMNMDRVLPLWITVIWAAHIGFDRALGYGLKYESGFSITHLGAIGRLKQA